MEPVRRIHTMLAAMLSATRAAASCMESRARCAYRAVVSTWAWPAASRSREGSRRAPTRARRSCGGSREAGHPAVSLARVRECRRIAAVRLSSGLVSPRDCPRCAECPPAHARPRATATPSARPSWCRRDAVPWFEVHVLPAQRQDLVLPVSGQHQEPDRRCGMHRDGAARLRLAERTPKPAELGRGEEPARASAPGIRLAPARVASVGQEAPGLRHVEHP